PVDNPSMINFWGPNGEEGKSVLALNISRIFSTGAKRTVTDLIVKGSKWLDSDTIMKVAEKRRITRDGYNIKENINYNNMKMWTPKAPVQSKGVSAYLSQTIIEITNKLGFSNTSSVKNSIGKRVMVYRIDKKLCKLEAFSKNAITNRVRMQFISMALSISDCYKRAPASLEMALESEFKKRTGYWSPKHKDRRVHQEIGRDVHRQIHEVSVQA
ncbi:hypothetical protein ACHAPQ_011508, partial [Fusarium lateritium]